MSGFWLFIIAVFMFFVMDELNGIGKQLKRIADHVDPPGEAGA